DALARRTQERQRRLPALDRLHVRGLHLRHVVDEQEGGEVVVDAGALQRLAGGQVVAARERLAPDLLVMGGAGRPRGAPLVVARNRGRHLLEVGEHDAVGDEAGAPMGDGGLEPGIGCHGSRSLKPLVPAKAGTQHCKPDFRWRGNEQVWGGFSHRQSVISSRRYQGIRRRVACLTMSSKPTPKAASSSTPTKASLWR